MILLSAAILALVFLTVMLVAGNNLSACVGPAIGSRIVSKRFGILVGAIGFSAGLLIQGATMSNSVTKLMPNPSPMLQAEALLVSILVFGIAFLIRVPMSVSMSLVGLMAGLSFAGNTSASGSYLAGVVLTWVLVPLVSLAVSFRLIYLLNRRWPKDFWRRLQTYKILLIGLSFSAAYVTGANTIGLIVATSGFSVFSISAAIIATFVGCFFLSSGAIRRVSQEFYLMRYPNAVATLVTSSILVETATILNIPLSITQTTSSAIFGIGISYKTKFVNTKPFLKTVLGWAVAPLLSFAIGALLGTLN